MVVSSKSTARIQVNRHTMPYETQTQYWAVLALRNILTVVPYLTKITSGVPFYCAWLILQLPAVTSYRLIVLISSRLVIVAYAVYTRNSWEISPTQVRLLNFERPSDALDYRPPPAPRRPGESSGNSGGGGGGSGSGGRGSRKQPLSPERVKEVLRLRVDFQRDAIDALDL